MELVHGYTGSGWHDQPGAPNQRAATNVALKDRDVELGNFQAGQYT